MSTLLDLPGTVSVRSFGEELQTAMAAVRLSIKWLGNHKKVSKDQKIQAAETFDAESNFVSMGKKLLDTNHDSWKNLVAVRGKMEAAWQERSLPFPESGIRLMKRSNLDSFVEKMNGLHDQLKDAEREYDRHYDLTIRHEARTRLGRLYNPDDYPASMIGVFDVTWEFPNVEAPAYLMQLSPELYERETERVKSRFNEAVVLAEQAFADELSKMIEHLLERLSGQDDGKPKVFRDSAVTNLNEFFSRFRELNIGSSPALDRLVTDAQRIVGSTSADDLRNSHVIRSEISRHLTDVQSSLDGLMVDRPRRNLIRPRNAVDTPGSNAVQHPEHRNATDR